MYAWYISVMMRAFGGFISTIDEYNVDMIEKTEVFCLGWIDYIMILMCYAFSHDPYLMYPNKHKFYTDGVFYVAKLYDGTFITFRGSLVMPNPVRTQQNNYVASANCYGSDDERYTVDISPTINKLFQNNRTSLNVNDVVFAHKVDEKKAQSSKHSMNNVSINVLDLNCLQERSFKNNDVILL